MYKNCLNLILLCEKLRFYVSLLSQQTFGWSKHKNVSMLCTCSLFSNLNSLVCFTQVNVCCLKIIAYFVTNFDFVHKFSNSQVFQLNELNLIKEVSDVICLDTYIDIIISVLKFSFQKIHQFYIYYKDWIKGINLTCSSYL